MAVALAGGCSPTSSNEPPIACEELQASARGTVEQAFTSNLACQVDRDCVEHAFQASCFDSYTRVVAGSAPDRVHFGTRSGILVRVEVVFFNMSRPCISKVRIAHMAC
jgi:hypothetical protein